MIEAVVMAAVVLLDQLTKLWASATFVGASTAAIPGVVNFCYVENTGAAFSMFSNGTLWLTIFSLLMAGILIFAIYRYKKQTTRPLRIFLAMIAGGAIGNLIDRVFAGYVVDFIEFAFMEFAVFNVADIFVTLGAIFLVIYVLFMKNGRKIFMKGLDEKDDGR